MTPAILLAATVVAFDVQDDERLQWIKGIGFRRGCEEMELRGMVRAAVPSVWRCDDVYEGGKIGSFGPVAQRTEQEASNLRVAGSIPARPANTQQSPGAGATVAPRSQATSAASAISWATSGSVGGRETPPPPAVPLPASWAALIGALALLTRLR